MNLLEVDALDVHYGDFQALYGVGLQVAEGQTLAVIGANGAGKSTLLKTLAGQVRATSGEIRLDGVALGRLPAHKRVPGIALTPEGRRIFASLTVEENLLVGAYRARKGPWTLDAVYDLFPFVRQRQDALGRSLSGGEQQAVAIGRALMCNPRLLLLDEVSLGLAPIVVTQLYEAMPLITGSGTTVLIVEQDVNQVMKVADHVHCLLEGRTVLSGEPAALTRERWLRPTSGSRGSPPVEWLNAVVQGVLLGGLYALLAAGLSLMFGVMRIVNLAHGVLAVFAAYLGLVLVRDVGLPPFVTIAVVVPAMAVVGYVLQRTLLGISLTRGPLAPLLVTFGLAVVLTNLLQQVFSADNQTIQIGALGASGVRFTDQLSIGVFSLITFLVGVAAITVVQLFLARTATGRAMRATSDDAEAASLMGIDNLHLYAVATAIALALVGLAGVFLGMRTQFSPTFGAVTLIFAFEAVIIGGLGSLWGTLAGGVVLGVAQAVGAQVAPAYGVLFGHVVFLAVLAFRPSGLFPKVVTA